MVTFLIIVATLSECEEIFFISSMASVLSKGLETVVLFIKDRQFSTYIRKWV